MQIKLSFIAQCIENYTTGAGFIRKVYAKEAHIQEIEACFKPEISNSTSKQFQDRDLTPEETIKVLGILLKKSDWKNDSASCKALRPLLVEITGFDEKQQLAYCNLRDKNLLTTSHVNILKAYPDHFSPLLALISTLYTHNGTAAFDLESLLNSKKIDIELLLGAEEKILAIERIKNITILSENIFLALINNSLDHANAVSEILVLFHKHQLLVDKNVNKVIQFDNPICLLEILNKLKSVNDKLINQDNVNKLVPAKVNDGFKQIIETFSLLKLTQINLNKILDNDIKNPEPFIALLKIFHGNEWSIELFLDNLLKSMDKTTQRNTAFKAYHNAFPYTLKNCSENHTIIQTLIDSPYQYAIIIDALKSLNNDTLKNDYLKAIFAKPLYADQLANLTMTLDKCVSREVISRNNFSKLLTPDNINYLFAKAVDIGKFNDFLLDSANASTLKKVFSLTHHSLAVTASKPDKNISAFMDELITAVLSYTKQKSQPTIAYSSKQTLFGQGANIPAARSDDLTTCLSPSIS